MLKHLDDEIILESYYKSIELNLDIDFVLILRDELTKRGISVEYTKLVI
ncbi:sporulation histidine kinase inhibitor Sda [bacterium LRH843]|nr:sporulation histidine kinase inhibitor Sda [bacterium LRH843]